MLGDMREEKKLSHLTPLSPIYPSSQHSLNVSNIIRSITVSLEKCLFPSGLTCPDFTSWPLMGARFQTFH